jgi:EpsD family peptidyl-prolyl cis-trans isomerase
MRSTRVLLLAAVACVALAGCGKKQPGGQVVATVKGKEITSIELRNEMNGFTAPTAEIRKAAEQQALNAIITRKVLAQAAEKAGIDKTPGFAQQEQRLKEVLLVQSWQSQIAKDVPPPSREEVDKFIADHPDLYSARKVFIVDQIRFPRPADPAIIEAFRPLKTLDDVSAFLASKSIPSRAGEDQLDAFALDPNVVTQLMKLPPGEVFIVPNGNILVANRIKETRVVPVPNDQAVKHATAYLKGQRTQEAMQRQFGGIMQAAKKDVVYSKAYEPKAPPAKGAAPAAKAQ